MSRIWDVMSRFGVGQAEWHPYWKNADLLMVQPEPIKASLYLRRAEGDRPSRCLLVVSNLSAKERATAQLQLDLGRIGMRATATAKDALSGERLALAGGRLSVALPPMRMHLVWLDEESGAMCVKGKLLMSSIATRVTMSVVYRVATAGVVVATL